MSSHKTRDRIIQAFTDILLEEKNADTPCFLDRIMEKAEVHRGLTSTPPDPLVTDLLLFEEHRVPRYTNLFCADCGRLTERLVTALFEITKGKAVDATIGTMKSLETEYDALRARWDRKSKKDSRRGKYPVWKSADFLVGDDRIVECKYRFNSYDAKFKQINIAEIYDELGFSPIFLHLTSDFLYKEKFEAKGWAVYVGQDMLDFIEQETGFDLRDLLSRTSSQPIVRQRILDAHDAMIERQKTELWQDYFYAPDEVKSSFVGAFAGDTESMTDMAQQVSSKGHGDLSPRMLQQHAETLCDKEMTRVDREKYSALLGVLLTLEESQRAELLCDTLEGSSPKTRAEVTSVYG